MKIQLKRSSVLDGSAAKKPTADQMEYGELAVNYSETDPAVFIKDSDNNIIRIAGKGANGSSELPDSGGGTHQPGTTDDRYIEVSGDTMTGQLELPGGGGTKEALQKQEIESLINSSDTGSGKYVEVAGDVMTGDLTLGANNITLDATGGAITAAGGVKIEGTNTPAGLWSGISKYGSLLIGTSSEAVGDAKVSIDSSDGSITAADNAFKVSTNGRVRSDESFRTGNVSVGSTSNTGVNIYSQGSIDAQRSASGPLFRGYQGTDENITIESSGSITAAGSATFTNAFTLNRETAPTPIRMGGSDTYAVWLNDSNFVLKYDGSASFVGDVQTGERIYRTGKTGFYFDSSYILPVKNGAESTDGSVNFGSATYPWGSSTFAGNMALDFSAGTTGEVFRVKSGSDRNILFNGDGSASFGGLTEHAGGLNTYNGDIYLYRNSAKDQGFKFDVAGNTLSSFSPDSNKKDFNITNETAGKNIFLTASDIQANCGRFGINSLDNNATFTVQENATDLKSINMLAQWSGGTGMYSQIMGDAEYTGEVAFYKTDISRAATSTFQDGSRLTGYQATYSLDQPGLSVGSSAEVMGFYSNVAGKSGYTYNFYAASNAPNFFQGLTTHAGGVNIEGSTSETSSLSRETSGSDTELKIQANTNDGQHGLKLYSTSAYNGQYSVDARRSTGVVSASVLRSIASGTGYSGFSTGFESIVTEDILEANSQYSLFNGAFFVANNASNITLAGYRSNIISLLAPNGQAYSNYHAGDAPNYFKGKVTTDAILESRSEIHCQADRADGNFPGAGNTLNGARLQYTGVSGFSASHANATSFVTLFNRTNFNGTLISFRKNGTEKGSIEIDDSNISIIGQTSDYRIKTNIQPVASAVSKVKTLNVVNFEYTDRAIGQTQEGFVAHELAEICPKAVRGAKDAEEAIGTLSDYDGTELETAVVEPDELTYTEEVEATPYVPAVAAVYGDAPLITPATESVIGPRGAVLVEAEEAVYGEPELISEAVPAQEATYETVTRTKTWTPTGTQPVYQGVDQTKLIPLLTKALQEALDKIEALETRLSDAGIA